MRRATGQHATMARIKPFSNLCAVIVLGPQLVIAHQYEFAVFALKTAHAICLVRHWRTIVHRLTQLR